MQTKTVYMFDVVSGAYAGVYDAQESPLEPGEFIMPEHCLNQAPPAMGANEVVVAVNGVWEVMPDFRSAKLFSTVTGLAVDVIEIGPQPSDTTDLPRPSLNHDWVAGAWALNFSKCKAAKFESLRLDRKDALAALAGIAGRAARKGDKATADAADAAAEALLGITTCSAVEAAVDEAGLDAALLGYYRAVVAAAPDVIVSAFSAVMS